MTCCCIYTCVYSFFFLSKSFWWSVGPFLILLSSKKAIVKIRVRWENIKENTRERDISVLNKLFACLMIHRGVNNCSVHYAPLNAVKNTLVKVARKYLNVLQIRRKKKKKIIRVRHFDFDLILQLIWLRIIIHKGQKFFFYDYKLLL